MVKAENLLDVYLWCYCFLKLGGKHLCHVAENLRIFKCAPASLILSGSVFFCAIVIHFGPVVEPGKLEIKVSENRLPKETLPFHKTRKLRSFFGLCNPYCRFLQNFSHVAVPLNEMLENRSLEFFKKLLADILYSFRKLIETLESDPILHLPQPPSYIRLTQKP